MFPLSPKDIKRFWSKIERREPFECWPWISKTRHWRGYGLFTLANGKPGGTKHVASRIACFLAHGPAPDGKPHALHRCDNPPCCNPHHLYWGSVKDNVHDAIARGRQAPPPRNAAYRKANPRRGATNPNAKLTDDIVREIWRLHFEGKNASEIAKAVHQSVAAVYDVCRGRSWRHLPDAPSVAALKAGGVRRGQEHKARGEACRTTVLTEADIPIIRASPLSLSQLARQFGVNKSTIAHIKSRRSWAHLP